MNATLLRGNGGRGLRYRLWIRVRGNAPRQCCGARCQCQGGPVTALPLAAECRRLRVCILRLLNTIVRGRKLTERTRELLGEMVLY